MKPRRLLAITAKAGEWSVHSEQVPESSRECSGDV